MKKCQFCGNEIPDNSIFCLYCMQPVKYIQEHKIPVKKKRRKLLVVILCILLVVVSVCSTWFVSRRFQTSQQYGNPLEKGVTVWVMKLQPNGGVDTFNFCYKNSIIGFGWGLDSSPKTINEYRKLRNDENKYPGDVTLDNTLSDFENMTSTGHYNLVWTVDTKGNYYICEIVGKYQYNRDEVHDKAGIVNFAKCKFYKVGSSDLVPKSVFELFEDDGVINNMLSEKDNETTTLLWQAAKLKQD